MNKLGKDIVVTIVLAFGIFVIPTILNYSFVDKTTDRFYERVDRDFDNCVKDAKENSKDEYWCKEIKKSSELAFNSASRTAQSYSNITIFQVILFVFLITVFNLRKRIEDLEKR